MKQAENFRAPQRPFSTQPEMQNAPGLEPHCPDLGGWWSLGFWRARNFQTTPRGPRKPPEPGHCNPGQSAGKQRRAGWQRRQRRPESVALGSASRAGRASGPGAPPEPRRAGRGAEARGCWQPGPGFLGRRPRSRRPSSAAAPPRVRPAPADVRVRSFPRSALRPGRAWPRRGRRPASGGGCYSAAASSPEPR